MYIPVSFQYLGKLLWWWFITSLPDFNSFQIRPTLGRNGRARALKQEWGMTDVTEDIYESFIVTSKINLRSINDELEKKLNGV